jgi:phosphoesterase RecJ-like protein
MAVDWTRFVEVVRTHQRFLLTGHVRPDCDALGSELGMAGILESLGNDVRIVNGQATPPNLTCIDPERRIKTLGQDVPAAALDEVEVLIVLDTSAWIQLGPMGDVLRSTAARKLVVDHHVSQDDLGAEVFKDVAAEATGRLVLEAAAQLGVPLTPAIARPLFAAIATDTGWFRFSSTTGDTYRAAAALVDVGVVPGELFAALYERDTIGRVRLRGVILSRVQTEMDGRLVHTYVLLDDFTRTGSLPSDTEDVINMTLAIAGTEVALIFVELPGGAFKVSFRSRGALDSRLVAEQFGGGGHRAAAGATIHGSYTDVRSRVLAAVRAALG